MSERILIWGTYINFEHLGNGKIGPKFMMGRLKLHESKSEPKFLMGRLELHESNSEPKFIMGRINLNSVSCYILR